MSDPAPDLPRYRTGDPGLDAAIVDLLDAAEVTSDRDLLFELLTSVLRMGRERMDRGDLKIANATLKEMRYAFSVFAPYRGVRKAAIFGSARTRPDERAYADAREVGRLLVASGWMAITGGGPGIMTAGIEGAGPEDSFAVSIVLPFEPAGGASMVADGRSINFRYFFNRKLTFMKEASGYVLFPGGFGTMDEAFELLTLIQTGRETPAPVVLFEPKGDAYWRSFRHFLEVELLDAGLVDEEDLGLFHLTSDPADAVAHLTAFYSTYHSMRWVGGRLVVRLNHDIDDEALERLNEAYADIVAVGRIERCEPSRAEVADGEHLDLPRLRFRFVNTRFARLHSLIRDLNALGAGD